MKKTIEQRLKQLTSDALRLAADMTDAEDARTPKVIAAHAQLAQAGEKGAADVG